VPDRVDQVGGRRFAEGRARGRHKRRAGLAVPGGALIAHHGDAWDTGESMLRTMARLYLNDIVQ
jgi:hypothetical protein